MKIIVYTDGSYSKSSPDETYGASAILDSDNNVILAQRYITTNRSLVLANNAGGEMLAAIGGITTSYSYLVAKQPGVSKEDVVGEIEVFYDYKGVELFIQGNPPWRAQKDSSKMYVKAIYDLKNQYPKVKLNFKHVAAHTGVYGNELVDSIAQGIIPFEVRDKLLPDMRL